MTADRTGVDLERAVRTSEVENRGSTFTRSALGDLGDRVA
jgi:hypothetical protein